MQSRGEHGQMWVALGCIGARFAFPRFPGLLSTPAKFATIVLLGRQVYWRDKTWTMAGRVMSNVRTTQ